jgi:hypothetical protein
MEQCNKTLMKIMDGICCTIFAGVMNRKQIAQLMVLG